MRILAIETSCDDTSIALADVNLRSCDVLRLDIKVLENIVSSQTEIHAHFGGVVPNLAKREHEKNLPKIFNKLLASGYTLKSDLIAVTVGPGLEPALWAGIEFAKKLSLELGVPLVGTNHLEGHLLAPFLKDDSYSPPADFNYPYIALAVSGGHTSLYWVKSFSDYMVIGTTKDDAAGEAFDKFAKMAGLGYPGGVQVDHNLMMIFSGLKSSAHRLLEKMPKDQIETERNDLCASFQEAIVDVLIAKTVKAAERYKCDKLVITGGVSANSRLREKMGELTSKYQIVIPPLRYCTDNAAMIGYAGILRLNRGEKNDLSLGPSAQLYEGDFSYDLQ